MISAYFRGNLPNWWPRWPEFIEVLRWLIPIVLLMIIYSFIDLIAANKTNVVVPDVATIIFTMISSFVFLHFVYLIPEKYRPASRYLNGLLEIVLQMLLVDLSIRFYFIPLGYSVNRICEKGKLKNFLETCLAFLCLFKHIKEFFNSLKSEEAFQWLRLNIGIIQLGIGIYLPGLYLRLLAIYYLAESILSFWFAPQVVTEMRTGGFENIWQHPSEASVN